MVKIHGSLWLILGAIILGYSFFIEGKADTNMTIFKIVGILFILWGAFRLTADYITREPKKKQELVGPPGKKPQPNQYHHTTGSPHQTHQHVRNPQGSQYQTHTHTKPAQHPGHHAASHALRHCPRCHEGIPQQVRFCPYCGMRFF